MTNKTSTVSFTLILLWISHLFVDLMFGIWPIFKTIAHLDLAVAGVITSFAAFAGEGAQIFFGPLSDRGYTRVLIAFGLLTTCANVLLPYASSYAAILGLFFLTCLGSGAFHPSAAGLASALTTTRKSFFMTVFASGGSIGIALSQIIFTQAFELLDSQIYLLALPSVFLAVIVYLYGSKQTTSKASNHLSTNWKGILALFRHRELRLLYCMQVANQALFWGIVFLLPDVLLSRGYDHWVAMGGGHLFFMLGGAAMMVLSGYLADKYSPKYVILAATFSSFFLFYAFIFSWKIPLFALIPLIFLNGAALGLINPVIVSMGNRLMPANPGTVSAFLMGLAWCFSEAIGLGGSGFLTKLFDEDAPAKALAVLCAMCIFCCLLATFRLPNVFKPEIETAPAPNLA